MARAAEPPGPAREREPETPSGQSQEVARRPAPLTGWRRWTAPDYDLDAAEDEARRPNFSRDHDAARARSANVSYNASADILKEAVKGELDRETNLNTRGAAVASVAALVISIFAAIFDASTLAEPWARSDAGRTAIAFFIVALALVAAAMTAAVMRVLRPMRGPKTKMFLGEQVIELWLEGPPERIGDTELQRRFVASSLATLPEWHYRNRRKARWLRRAYVFLGLGILAIGGGITLVLHARAVFPLRDTVALVVIAALITLVAFRYDLFWAAERAAKEPRRARQAEPERE